jgi:hypothetical protein
VYYVFYVFFYADLWSGKIPLWSGFCLEQAQLCKALWYLVPNCTYLQLFWLRLFIFAFSEKTMNTCLWHLYFCCSNIVVIVDVSFASAVCPIQYTVDLTSVCQKFVMSVIHYSCGTLPHTSALNHHIHQTSFVVWRFSSVLHQVCLSSFVFCVCVRARTCVTLSILK